MPAPPGASQARPRRQHKSIGAHPRSRRHPASRSLTRRVAALTASRRLLIFIARSRQLQASRHRCSRLAERAPPPPGADHLIWEADPAPVHAHVAPPGRGGETAGQAPRRTPSDAQIIGDTHQVSSEILSTSERGTATRSWSICPTHIPTRRATPCALRVGRLSITRTAGTSATVASRACPAYPHRIHRVETRHQRCHPAPSGTSAWRGLARPSVRVLPAQLYD